MNTIFMKTWKIVAKINYMQIYHPTYLNMQIDAAIIITIFSYVTRFNFQKIAFVKIKKFRYDSSS